MPRNSKVIGIEQSLGLVSDRGISRRGYKDAPAMQELLRGVKEISLKYVHMAPAEIRESQGLENDAIDLFGKIGTKVWPANGIPRPSWLADPAKDNLGGKYKRELRYANDGDRQELQTLFIQLVIEKTCILHDNEQAKIRKLRQGLLDSVIADGEDELPSDMDATMMESPAPTAGSHTTRSSHALHTQTSKPNFVDEPRPGFQAVNHAPVNRGGINSSGTLKDAAFPATTASAKASSVDEKALPQQDERPIHETPTRGANSRVTRKRANTAEQTGAGKKSCVTGEDGETLEGPLSIRSAAQSLPDTKPPTSAQKSAKLSERNQARPKRETTRAATQTRSSERRVKSKRSSTSHPAAPSEAARDVLGDLVDCASVSELLRLSPHLKYNSYMLKTMKDALTRNPAAKENLDVLHRTLEEITGNGVDKIPPEQPNGLTGAPSAIEATRRPLALVEMNWGLDLDFIEAFELPAVQTVQEFFHLVESHFPREVKSSGRTLKEINVTPITDVAGGRKINFRISNDPDRGRASLRLMMHRLKLQPPGADDDIGAELMFTAVWDD